MTLHLGPTRRRPGSSMSASGAAHTWIDLAGAVFAAMEPARAIDFVDMPAQLRGKYQYSTVGVHRQASRHRLHAAADAARRGRARLRAQLPDAGPSPRRLRRAGRVVPDPRQRHAVTTSRGDRRRGGRNHGGDLRRRRRRRNPAARAHARRRPQDPDQRRRPLQHPSRRGSTSRGSSPIRRRTSLRKILRSWPLARADRASSSRTLGIPLVEEAESAKLFPAIESCPRRARPAARAGAARGARRCA